MKIPVSILLFFWLAPWLAKNQWPDVFGNEIIQWPSVLIVALLSPYVFLSSLNAKKPLFAFIVLSIPVINIGLYTSVNIDALNVIEKTNKRIQSPELFDMKVKYLEKTSEDEKKEKIAQVVYLHHGIILSYQLSDGSFVKFIPTKSETESYKKQEETNKKIASLNMQLIFQLKERNILAFIDLTLFALVIGIMLLWQRVKS